MAWECGERIRECGVAPGRHRVKEECIPGFMFFGAILTVLLMIVWLIVGILVIVLLLKKFRKLKIPNFFTGLTEGIVHIGGTP